MKITLAIATYNRLDYVERMSASLLASGVMEQVHVRIYDDCSPLLTVEDLHRLFPYATEVVRREQNLRADANMKQIFEDFLKTEDEVLLLADSDLLYRTEWLKTLKELLPQTDGILSLYNSRLHPFVGGGSEADTLMSPKEDLGAAGTAFTRERVQDIVDAQMPPDTYDWAWSALFRQKGYRLMCLHDSYIQHIGIIGQNNRGSILHFDSGLNFVADNLPTQQAMAQFVDELIAEHISFNENIGINKNFTDMRVYDSKFEGDSTLCKIRGGGCSIMHIFRVKVRQVLFRLLVQLE